MVAQLEPLDCLNLYRLFPEFHFLSFTHKQSKQMRIIKRTNQFGSLPFTGR
jgi:hypothetical protein